MGPPGVRLDGSNTEGSCNRYASGNARSSTSSRRVGGLKAEEPGRGAFKCVRGEAGDNHAPLQAPLQALSPPLKPHLKSPLNTPLKQPRSPPLSHPLRSSPCKAISKADRPIGTHVPSTWSWKAAMEIPQGPLFHQEAMQVFKNSCVLCRHKVGHSRITLAT